MKCLPWSIAGYCALALSTASLWGQEENVKVRVRAIAVPGGNVEVVEETVEGDAKDQPKDEETVRKTVIRRLIEARAQAAAAKEPTEKIADDEAQLPQSKYWIGVQIGEVSPEVRKHMSVKHGVLIIHVYADSPAEKASLAVDDVLIQAGDVKIETPPDLIKAVDAAETKELTFKLLREGEERSIKVTPMKRPGEEELAPRAQETTRTFRLHSAQQALEKALAALKAEADEENVVDFMLVRPGAYLHGMKVAEAKLPDNVSIQIKKEGNKPAKVEVKQGDKTYQATEGKLDELPKELRGHVERMLSGGPGMLTLTAPEAHPQMFEMKVAPPVAGGKVVARAMAPQAVPALPGVPGLPAVAPLQGMPSGTFIPLSPGTPARVTWSAAATHSPTDAKLDQILKKLDALASPDLEAMKKELKALRKEVDELQKKSSGSEASK